MTEEDIKKLQSTGGEHLAATEKNILGNNLHNLADYVLNLKGGRIDFVLDNAGFELYCDLVYADWLIQSGIADKIVFHGECHDARVCLQGAMLTLARKAHSLVRQ